MHYTIQFHLDATRLLQSHASTPEAARNLANRVMEKLFEDFDNPVQNPVTAASLHPKGNGRMDMSLSPLAHKQLQQIDDHLNSIAKLAARSGNDDAVHSLAEILGQGFADTLQDLSLTAMISHKGPVIIESFDSRRPRASRGLNLN